MSIYGGRHATRKAMKMSDGRVPSSDTALELWGEGLLIELGFKPRKLENGIRMTAEIIARAGEWRPRDVSEVTKHPDRLVDVGSVTKVILFDGWDVHNRTKNDDRETKRENSLYNAAGYSVVRVGDTWMANLKRTERLKPMLRAAIFSAELVVDISS
jgi:hypothetical protein